jgi:hypothetical protein
MVVTALSVKSRLPPFGKEFRGLLCCAENVLIRCQLDSGRAGFIRRPNAA